MPLRLGLAASLSLINLLTPQAELETARASIKRQTASSAKSSAGMSSAQEENAALLAQVAQLEASVRGWKAKEREARAELDGWLKEEKSKDGAVSKATRRHVRQRSEDCPT